MANKSIGQRIQEVFEASGMSKKDFADKLCTTRTNLYSIFKKDNIDIDFLLKISKVLDHDFLQYYKEGNERKNVYFRDQWISEDEFAGIIDESNKKQLKENYQLANAYFAGKKRKPHYYVNFITEFNESVDWGVYLSNEDIEALRKRIMEDNSYLTDVLDWNELVDTKEWGWGEIVEVVSVDFTPCYAYLFTCSQLKSPDAEPMSIDYLVGMTDTQYLRLLTMVMRERYLTVAQLQQRDPELYNLINDSAYKIKCLIYPYVIFMKEIQKDINNIVGPVE